MPQKRGVKQEFSKARLFFLALVFFAINVLVLGLNSFSSDFVQWLVILSMDSFLLVSGLSIFFLWRRISPDLVESEPLGEESEMATVMVDRLKKYVRDEQRENNGL